MDSEIIRAVQKHDKQGEADSGERTAHISTANISSDDLYKEVITPLIAEFSDPIVAPHWWKKPVETFKGFAVKTRINNTIWRQWYVHFVKGKDTVVKFANPIPLADKYHARVLAVVVEGHYWCRKHGAIRAQYNNWRQNRKPISPKLKIDNLILTNTVKQDEVISPGIDDLVLSGMLNGFSDLHALDLSVQFDLPDSFKDYDLILNSDTQVREPMQSSCSNGYTDHRPAHIMYPHPGRAAGGGGGGSTTHVDTTSLNTLATAADMSEYYRSTTQSQYLPPAAYHGAPYEQPGYVQDRQYSGVTTGQTADRQFATGQTADRQFANTRSPGAPSVVPVADYSTLTNSHDNSYLAGNMPAPKGPAYYPPTRLQYCYSDKGGYNQALTQQPPTLPPFPHHQTNYTDQQQTQTPFKQKPSEIEVDRKRRRAMKDRLRTVEEILPPATPGTKYTHAVILNKAASHIRNEESILSALDAEVVRLNSLIEQTKSQIAAHQSQIPENGISSACFGSSIVEAQYTEFLEEQVNANPLMKLYSSMLEPLFLTFNSMVDNTSLDSFCKTAHQWFAQNCSLAKLRELATNLVTSPNLEFESSSGS